MDTADAILESVISDLQRLRREARNEPNGFDKDDLQSKIEEMIEHKFSSLAGPVAGGPSPTKKTRTTLNCPHCGSAIKVSIKK